MPRESGPKILVVEDERHIARFLEFVLQRQGFAVDSVFDGAVAEAKVQSTIYAAILLDLGLPGRSGLEVLSFIRSLAQPARPIVIVLTAKSSGDVLSQVLAAGADAYCPKPVAPSTLLKRLRELGLIAESSRDPQLLRQAWV
jgi:two-component system response regulator ArlR